MNVAHGGEPGPDVEELGDPRLHAQVLDRALAERPVLPRRLPHPGPGLQQSLGDHAVRREVVLAAQEEVINPRWMRRGGVDTRDNAILAHPRPFDTLAPFGQIYSPIGHGRGAGGLWLAADPGEQGAPGEG